MRKPVRELVLTALATGATGATWLAPQTPWLAPALQPLALGLGSTWALWRAVAFSGALEEYRAWTRLPTWVLDPRGLSYTPAGLLLGKGFRWTGAHTQILETALATDGALPVAQESRGGYPALHAVGRREERTLRAPWSELPGHMLLTGTTRSGKTTTLQAIATSTIAGRGCTIILDPKGSRDLMIRCAVEARRRGKRFALLTPAFPHLSATMNVLGMATSPEEVSARISALMPSGRDPFFQEYPLAIIEHIAEAHQALGIPWTLRNLYRPAVLRRYLEDLALAYLGHLGYPEPTLAKARNAYKKAGREDAIADALLDDLDKPRDHFMKVTANLIPAFRGVVGQRLGHLFSTLPPDLTWRRIVDEEMVVYVALASLLIKDIANRIGRVILQDLIGFVGQRYAYEDCTAVPPINVLIDEVARVSYPDFPTALAMAGEAQVRFYLAQQSMADMEAALGNVAMAEQIYDNCNTRLYHRITSNRTVEQATDGLGTCTVVLPTNGVGVHYGGVGGLSGQHTRTLAPKDTALIRPEWLTALPRGEAFVRMRGEVWKIRVPLLTPVSDAELDATGLRELYQALPSGDHPPLPPAPAKQLPPPVLALPPGPPKLLPPGKTDEVPPA